MGHEACHRAIENLAADERGSTRIGESEIGNFIAVYASYAIGHIRVYPRASVAKYLSVTRWPTIPPGASLARSIHSAKADPRSASSNLHRRKPRHPRVRVRWLGFSHRQSP